MFRSLRPRVSSFRRGDHQPGWVDWRTLLWFVNFFWTEVNGILSISATRFSVYSFISRRYDEETKNPKKYSLRHCLVLWSTAFSFQSRFLSTGILNFNSSSSRHLHSPQRWSSSCLVMFITCNTTRTHNKISKKKLMMRFATKFEWKIFIWWWELSLE